MCSLYKPKFTTKKPTFVAPKKDSIMAEPTENISKQAPFQTRRRGNLSANADFVDYGKLPPQAKDLEEAVLGALMLEKDAIDTVADILKPDSFYVEAHQVIYRAIVQLYRNNEPIDMLTVVTRLRQNGELEKIGGPYYVAQLTNKVASAANIEFHARIVAQKYIQRELITSSTEIIRDAYEDTTDVFELLDKAETSIMNISENNIKKASEDIASIIKKEMDELNVRIHSDEHLNGVSSGFRELDKFTGGWQKSDLIIVAARPGMGKTAFTLALARNSAVDHKKPVAIFSLEMSSGQLVQRMISMETEISAEKIRRGDMKEYELLQLTSKLDNLGKAQIFIDDTPGINLFELRSKVRKLHQKHGISLLVIDYLQLMSGSHDGKGGGNREQEISQISRGLKSLAKELNIPIIALSQLSRATETRGGDKKPLLSDLRESGAIEQDADIVIFLYRGEYYGIETDSEGNSSKGIAEIILAKHRNGQLGTVKAKFINHLAKFADMHDIVTDEQIAIENNGNKQIFKKFSSRMNDPQQDSGNIDASRSHKTDDFDDDSPPF